MKIILINICFILIIFQLRALAQSNFEKIKLVGRVKEEGNINKKISKATVSYASSTSVTIDVCVTNIDGEFRFGIMDIPKFKKIAIHVSKKGYYPKKEALFDVRSFSSNDKEKKIFLRPIDYRGNKNTNLKRQLEKNQQGKEIRLAAASDSLFKTDKNGDLLTNVNETAQIRDLINNDEKLDSSYKMAPIDSAKSEFYKGNTTNAIAINRNIINSSSKVNPEVYYRQSIFYQSFLNYDSANYFINLAIQSSSGDSMNQVKYVLEKASILIKNNTNKDSIRVCARELKRINEKYQQFITNNSQAKIFFLLGALQYDETAITFYKKADNIMKDNCFDSSLYIDLNMNLALSLNAIGRKCKAKKRMCKAIKIIEFTYDDLNPYKALLFTKVGDYYLNSAKFKRSKKYYERSVRILDKDFPEGYQDKVKNNFSLAFSQFYLGKNKNAVNIFNESIENNIAFIDSKEYLAKSYYYQGIAMQRSLKNRSNIFGKMFTNDWRKDSLEMMQSLKFYFLAMNEANSLESSNEQINIKAKIYLALAYYYNSEFIYKSTEDQNTLKSNYQIFKDSINTKIKGLVDSALINESDLEQGLKYELKYYKALCSIDLSKEPWNSYRKKLITEISDDRISNPSVIKIKKKIKKLKAPKSEYHKIYHRNYEVPLNFKI